MNSKATVFINPTTSVSGRMWVDVQGYADICPIISPTKRTEPRRINTTDEDRRPSGRLFIDFFWVWLLFGNEKRPEKSGDFEPCRCGDDWKLPGYRGERGISPGLAAALWGFGAG